MAAAAGAARVREVRPCRLGQGGRDQQGRGAEMEIAPEDHACAERCEVWQKPYIISSNYLSLYFSAYICKDFVLLLYIVLGSTRVISNPDYKKHARANRGKNGAPFRYPVAVPIACDR